MSRGGIQAGLGLDRATDRLRHVLQQTAQEAQKLLHDHVGTEHLLLSLLKEQTGVATLALQKLGLDFGAAAASITKLRPRSDALIIGGPRPYAPRAAEVRRGMSEEAAKLGHSYLVPK